MEGFFEKNDLKLTIKRIHGFDAYEPRFHSHMEIVYVFSGTIPVSINGIKRNLSAGEMSITFPYSVHSYGASPDSDSVILMFDPAIIEIFEKKIISSMPSNPFISNASSIYPLLDKLLYYSEMEGEDYAKMMNIYLMALIGEILLTLNLSDVEQTPLGTIQKILVYCSNHYTEDITIKSVAQSLYLSESSISKVFSKKLGFSFRDYINHLRISKARYYLEKTHMKILDVMYSCGFKNQSSFNRVFMDICGITPSECKNNQQQ